MAKTEVQGVPELAAKFRELDDAMSKRTGARMVVAGGQILKNGAKTILRQKGLVKTGALIKNVAIKRETGTPKGVIQYNLGVRHGPALTKKQKSKNFLSVNAKGRIVKRYQDDPYYFRFPEFGTKHQARQSYLAESLDANHTTAVDAMMQRLEEELQKAQAK